MKSMTGYGRGECAEHGFKVTTEVSSVNRKQTEIAVYLPRELEALEPRVRNEVNRRVARGKLTLRIGLHAGEEALGSQVKINHALARGYVKELRKLAKELSIPDDISLELLARAPGVFLSDELTKDAEHWWPAVEKSVAQAVDALIKMRTREGQHLAKDLKARIGIMRKGVARIKKEAPAMVRRYQEQLRERIQNAGLPLPPEDDERLLKEVVYFADRSDITEELTRLESHFNQFDECSASPDPVGRTLDFLAQEMNREVNTIGSKANASAISKEVVLLKTELEKFREQALNVE